MYHKELKEIIQSCLNILLLICKIRMNLQVLAFIKMFKISYNTHKRFKCSIGEFEKLFDFFSFERSSQAARRSTNVLNTEEGSTNTLAIGKNKIWQKTPNSSSTSLNSARKNRKENLVEDINFIQKRTGISIIHELYLIYNDTVKNVFLTTGSQLSAMSKINLSIQNKIFSILQQTFSQRELFSA